MHARTEIDAGEDAVHARHVGRRTADRADAFAAVEVLRRLMLADAVHARSQAVEHVLAESVGERRGEDVAVTVEQVDLHAREPGVIRIIEIAVLVGSA